MKTYIFSWGGGVNSTAILAMIKLGMLPELTKDNTHIVFADTGAEMHYTYEHTSECLQPMARDGWTCKVLRPYSHQEFYSKRCKDKTLEDYCLEKMCMPSRINRWCTIEWKTTPIKNYRKSISKEDYLKETIMILGIAIDEKHRAKELGVEHTYYPLIEQNIDRQGCFDLCNKAELPLPRKSGCYFCPYQSKPQWLELYKDLPDYFAKAERVETVAHTRYNGKGYYLRGEIPIREQVLKWVEKEKLAQKKECEQTDLFEENRHCLCEL